MDRLDFAFSLKIHPVLILVSVVYSWSSFAKKNKRLLAVYVSNQSKFSGIHTHSDLQVALKANISEIEENRELIKVIIIIIIINNKIK